jgi:hypothetical protein
MYVIIRYMNGKRSYVCEWEIEGDPRVRGRTLGANHNDEIGKIKNYKC